MWLTGLVAPWHMGSSQTRARTRVPCISRQILNHCATKEARCLIFKLILTSTLTASLLNIHPSFLFGAPTSMTPLFRRNPWGAPVPNHGSFLQTLKILPDVQRLGGRAEGMGLHGWGTCPGMTVMPLFEEIPGFYFHTIECEPIHIGRNYGKINNGNHFSLTSQVI